MRAVLQRVSRASVRADGELIGEIEKGYLILLGAAEDDTEEIAAKLADKIGRLRIFEDEEGKTNLSLSDVKGEILVVSQFTLLADCKKGNRPSFIRAGKPDHAEHLYRHFTKCCQAYTSKTACGKFGAEMEVSLVNDGPFTLVLECDKDGIHS